MCFCPVSLETGVSHWVQLQRAVRIMRAIRAIFKKPLVPYRGSYSSGLVLPPVCDGAGCRGGELTSQHHPPLSCGLEGPGVYGKSFISGFEMGSAGATGLGFGARGCPGVLHTLLWHSYRYPWLVQGVLLSAWELLWSTNYLGIALVTHCAQTSPVVPPAPHHPP